MLPLYLKAPSASRCRCSPSAPTPMTSRSAPAGLLLSLAESRLGFSYVVLTGTAERQQEARDAAHAFLPGADLAVELFQLPEGRLPAVWGR